MADDFEAPLLALQKRIEELAAFPGDAVKEQEARRLRQELSEKRRSIYAALTPWQKTQVARHPNRPYTLDYIGALFTDFTELHGDRRFGDDPALVTGFARYKDRAVAVIGHQKGRDTKQKIYRNFGMPKPEGYRKALRVMQLAAKFGRPIISFVDTPGAYPGLDAEERGQAEAIAYNLREMSRLPTPIIVNVTGEGGSGGALAVAVGDRVNMLEHSIYSVISPEGCASILWRDAGRAEEAATAMKITAPDLKGFGLIDEIVPEPPGGAHADPDTLFASLDRILEAQLRELSALPVEALAGRPLREVPPDGPAGPRVPRSPVIVRAVGIVGAGTMGQGIAVACAAAGLDVLVSERTPQSAQAALAEIVQGLDADIAKWRRTESEKKAILARIRTVDSFGALEAAQLVIEAVPDDLELKTAIFQELDLVCPPEDILATNTSALSVSQIAARTKRPDRIIGLHFLTPVPVVPLVEVVRGLSTSDQTFRDALEFVRLLGKTGIEVFESPGYVTTRVILPFINEAMYVVMEGVASAEAVDTSMRLGYGMPLGPLALADRMGLDEVMRWMQHLFDELGDLKYRPCPLLRKMVRAGRLGVKTGSGFFEYDDQGRVKGAPASPER